MGLSRVQVPVDLRRQRILLPAGGEGDGHPRRRAKGGDVWEGRFRDVPGRDELHVGRERGGGEALRVLLSTSGAGRCAGVLWEEIDFETEGPAFGSAANTGVRYQLIS